VRCQEQESCSILVERTRESKREVELRKETTFVEEENASQSKEKYGFQTARMNRPYRTNLWRSYCM
jgi:transposase-like protein